MHLLYRKIKVENHVKKTFVEFDKSHWDPHPQSFNTACQHGTVTNMKHRNNLTCDMDISQILK